MIAWHRDDVHAIAADLHVEPWFVETRDRSLTTDEAAIVGWHLGGMEWAS